MLESIQLGKDALKFVDLKGTVLMLSSGRFFQLFRIDLPKLTTLTTRGDSESFWGPHIVTFEGAFVEMVLQTDLPALTTATFFSSFHGAHKWRVFSRCDCKGVMDRRGRVGVTLWRVQAWHSLEH